jgi:hypothetical protein
LVAVGEVGTVLTSPDGVTWTARNSGIGTALEGVVWAGDRLVAVGGDAAGSGHGTLDVILTSPDGISWTNQHSASVKPLHSVAWNGNQYVAGGVEGAVLTSPQEVSAVLPGDFVIRVNGQEQPYAFQLPAGTTTERMTLSILDAWGRTIWAKSVSPAQDKAIEVSWNGRSAKGSLVSAGMYIVRLSVLNSGTTTHYVRKAVTLKPR